MRSKMPTDLPPEMPCSIMLVVEGCSGFFGFRVFRV